MPGCSDVDLVPPSLAAEIDALNEQIYDKVPACARFCCNPTGGSSSRSFFLPLTLVMSVDADSLVRQPRGEVTERKGLKESYASVWRSGFPS